MNWVLLIESWSRISPIGSSLTSYEVIIAIGSFAASETEIGWNVLGFKQYLISLCILLLCLQVSGIPIKIYLSLLMNLVSNHSRIGWNLLNIPETDWRYCITMPFNTPNTCVEIGNITRWMSTRQFVLQYPWTEFKVVNFKSS